MRGPGEKLGGVAALLSLLLPLDHAAAQAGAAGDAESASATTASPSPAAPSSVAAPSSSESSVPAADAPTPDQVAAEAALARIAPGGVFDLLPRTPPGEGGLTAAGTVERALAVSVSVHSAGASAATARRRAERAVVLFVPRLDLTARYMRLSGVPAPPGFGSLFPVLLDTYSLRAALKVPVSEYFLSLKDRYDSAQRLESFEELQRQAEHQEVAYQARREYYELARALSADTLSIHRVSQLEHFASEIQVLVDGGELGIVSLAQARSRLASARAAAERERANRRVAEETVRRRLALPLGAPVGIAEALTSELPALPAELEPLLHEANGKRPEVLALRELIAAHGHNSAATAAGRYPSLSLVGEVALENPNQRYVPQRDQFDESWAVGVELTWSPTELATQNDALDGSRLEETRARAELDQLRSRVVVEITSAYEQARAATTSIDAFEQAVSAAQQALDAELALFRAGETSSRQVLDAELDLRMAQLQWVDGVLSAHLARAALDRAIGRVP